MQAVSGVADGGAVCGRVRTTYGKCYATLAVLCADCTRSKSVSGRRAGALRLRERINGLQIVRCTATRNAMHVYGDWRSYFPDSPF